MEPPFDDLAETDHELGTAEGGDAITFALNVIEGPSTGASLVLAPGGAGPVLVGVSATCALRLGDRAVSRRHASIEHLGRRLRWTDLRSTNGSTIDGVAVESAFLRGGEVVRIGGSALRVDVVGGARPDALPLRARFFATIGASIEMRRLYRMCERLAATDVPIVIEGETGTGKEVLAESIHAASSRAARPFVVFDCTAVPPSLFESELFGHERGAFTGATSTRIGALEEANGGTLLIDEVGDLDLPLQAKLLRAVETRTVRRVGGDRAIRFDVRVLAATRRDLDREVQEGRFRDDLFHRLAVSRIELPPLRRRTGDVKLLVSHFWTELGGGGDGPGEAQLRRWEDHDWPGNIRELRNAVARHIALGDLAHAGPPPSSRVAPQGEVRDGSLDALVREEVGRRATLSEARDRVLRAFEKSFLDALAANHGGDLDKVAAAAGIGRRYLNMIRARGRR